MYVANFELFSAVSDALFDVLCTYNLFPYFLFLQYFHLKARQKGEEEETSKCERNRLYAELGAIDPTGESSVAMVTVLLLLCHH